MKSVEQIPGFDKRVKLKDLDLQKMDISSSDTKPTYDGLLEEDSLALFDEEIAEMESEKNFACFVLNFCTYSFTFIGFSGCQFNFSFHFCLVD